MNKVMNTPVLYLNMIFCIFFRPELYDCIQFCQSNISAMHSTLMLLRT